MNNFSKKEAIGFGWQTFKANWKFLVGLTILVTLINVVPGWLADRLSSDYAAIAFVLSLATWLVNLVVSLGTLRIYLLVADGQPAGLKDLFSCGHLILKYIIGSIVSGFIIVGGLLLLLIPGLILSIKLQFWPWFMVEQNLGPIAALKESWRVTSGIKWNLFLFNLLLGLITLAGLLALGLGLLIAIPVSQLATAFVYRRLSQTS